MADQGATGERGPKGDHGQIGDQGDQGVPGLQSQIPGGQGDRGERGPKGDHGQDGHDGREGARGLQGERGEKGRREDNPFVMVGGLVQNVGFIAAFFLLLGTAALLFQIVDSRSDDKVLLHLTEEAADQRASLQDQADRIIDCTDPGGKCFAEGQRRTAESIASINIVSQFAVICGEQEDGEAAILECVNSSVKAYLKQEANNDK